MQLLKQSTAATILVGPVLDAAGAAVTTAVAGNFNLTKNGTTAALTSETVTHSHNGHYTIAATTGNTDTLGRLTVTANNAAHAMSSHRYSVLTATTFDALITNAANAAGGLQDVQRIAGTTQTARDIGASVLLSSGTGAGQLKLASGYVAMTWADIAAPTTAVALTGTTIAATQKVDVDTIKTNPVVNAGTITFPTTATLASTTNITAGTIATVTTLTNLPAIPANWLTSAGIAAAALNGKGDWNTTTPPSVAAIATAVWQDATAGDFTVASSIGRSLYTTGVLPGAAGGLFIAGTNAATAVTTSFTTTFTGNVTGSVGSVTGSTAQTGDSFARLGAPAGASVSADLAAIFADGPAKVTKNVAFADFPFVLRNSSNHVVGQTGVTVTSQRSIDGGAFANCANTATEISAGAYKISLAASDLNGNSILLKFSGALADTLFVLIVTQPT